MGQARPFSREKQERWTDLGRVTLPSDDDITPTAPVLLNREKTSKTFSRLVKAAAAALEKPNRQ